MLLINHPAAPLYREPYAAELDDEAWYGQRAEIIDDMGEFCRVRMDYGYVSCIRRRHLADHSYQSRPARIGFRFADVRSMPDIKARILLTLPKGALIQTTGEEKGWTKVRLLDGREGYLYSKALEGWDAHCSEDELRKRIAETAMEYLDVPYRWGGRTPVGVDCSGLCHSAYLIHGIAIYRNASIQPGYPVMKIASDKAKKADLLYFPGHIAMYLGDGRYIHATAREGRVCINSLEQDSPLYREDLADSFICAGSVF